MKKIKFAFLASTLAVILCSCGYKAPTSSSRRPSSSSSTNTSSVSVEEGDEIFNVYSINDFHGSILERTIDGKFEGGLLKIGGYLKAQKEADPEHTIILSSGDMWQGSLESNYNHGYLVTEAMNYIGFDAMTLGNHDFDYGQDWLLKNKELADFPFLAANINMWDKTMRRPTATRWDKTDDSVVLERGGKKIGVVGVIGYGQTTSITSPNVSDLYFSDPKMYAQNEAVRLRNQGCDAVILSIHSSVSVVSGWGGAKKYFDAVFGGHTHYEENSKTADGVPMLQAACNGEYISHFEIKFSKDNVVTVTDAENIEASSRWNRDKGINSIMNKYLDTEEFNTMSNRECGTLNGKLTKYTVANAGCKAIYEKYKNEFPDLALAMENSQRSSINAGKFTYSDLYKATPFMNNIVIAKLKGEDILQEAKMTYTYTGDIAKFGTLKSNEYYTIAVIDYLAYHQDYNKSYDYFPSFKEENVLAVKETYPVDLTYDYFKSIGPNINSYDFSGADKGFGIYN
ncbi:MAG: bifunctional metallophosphatase/5'-nucleotidase [Bacilli bacterium]|nr:bifunctional metallophosphatase/5'-nucleotidase [Bacilli bacterium]